MTPDAMKEELAEAQREERRLGRRLEALERERAERLALIESLEHDVAQVAASRSFRLGHGAMRRLSRWLLWRPARRSALDVAAERLALARDRLDWDGSPRSERQAAAAAGPDLKPLVYDIGMNEGQNLPYYLAKGCRVVAVEAAPPLVEEVRGRFAAEIAKGDLTVLNLGISSGKGSLPFYFNTVSTFRSSFRRPRELDAKWTVIDVPTVRLSELLQEHGPPHFLKIDIEHFDRFALLDLMQAGIVPSNLSVEVHSIDVLSALIAMGYTEFQLVNGSDIGRSIAHRQIRRIDGSTVDHDFPRHSAGPFGDDLDGEWVSARGVSDQWLSWRRPGRRGWMDAHARKPELGLPGSGP